jgi:signal transduction histidine kinase
MTARHGKPGADFLEIQPDLPKAKTIQSRLEQIVANLVLNAIQQIEKQSLFMAGYSAKSGEARQLLAFGAVVVRASYDPTASPHPIQIAVIDSGPGIHYHDQERIFMLDTSTRATGQGLGLFISRNLAESMGGQLHLVDSLIFLGSAFLIELPEA